MLMSELDIDNYIKIYTSDIIRKESMTEEGIKMFINDIINAMGSLSEDQLTDTNPDNIVQVSVT
jgi:hypothetical protein